jgi:peroxiredoxin (alkyl hydroperoxide reductase subunit C)
MFLAGNPQSISSACGRCVSGTPGKHEGYATAYQDKITAPTRKSLGKDRKKRWAAAFRARRPVRPGADSVKVARIVVATPMVFSLHAIHAIRCVLYQFRGAGMKANVKSAAVAVVLSAGLSLFSLTASATLKPGEHAPDFTTQASLGGKTFTWSLAQELKKGPVVLYFYPAAFTTDCTIEAHEFADAVDEYKKYGATVIGVSHDNIATLTKFSVSECRSKFPVAADAHGKVIDAYDAGLPMHAAMADRVSYVIAPDGKIIYEYTSSSPDKHVENTMRAVKEWALAHK